MHFVERVTNGVRYAITISFTCDHKEAIPDPFAATVWQGVAQWLILRLPFPRQEYNLVSEVTQISKKKKKS